MWIFTTLGMFSAVCARTGDGRITNPPDPNRMMVRARVVEHLHALIREFPQLRGCNVHISTGSDYHARIFMAKSTWLRVMDHLIESVDYDNFKAAVDRDEVKRDDQMDYHKWLIQVWGVGKRTQDNMYAPLFDPLEHRMHVVADGYAPSPDFDEASRGIMRPASKGKKRKAKKRGRRNRRT